MHECSGPGDGPDAPEEDLPEGLAEAGVEDGVDDGVEQAVEVAEPEEERDEHGRHVHGEGQEGPQQGQDEEGQPAQHEGPRDDAQHARRLPLPPHLQLLPPLFLLLPVAGPLGVVVGALLAGLQRSLPRHRQVVAAGVEAVAGVGDQVVGAAQVRTQPVAAVVGSVPQHGQAVAPVVGVVVVAVVVLVVVVVKVVAVGHEGGGGARAVVAVPPVWFGAVGVLHRTPPVPLFEGGGGHWRPHLPCSVPAIMALAPTVLHHPSLHSRHLHGLRYFTAVRLCPRTLWWPRHSVCTLLWTAPLTTVHTAGCTLSLTHV